MEIIDGGCFNDVPAGGGGWTYLGSFDPTTPEELTGIPSTATSVKVMVNGVSYTVNSSEMYIELGDSTSGIGNGYATSGLSACVNLDGSPNSGASGSFSDTAIVTNGKFVFTPGNTPAANFYHGVVVFDKEDDSSNVWQGTGNVINNSTSNGASVPRSSGRITVLGALNKIKLSLDGGAFDAGTVHVWYQ